jgi:hypothetical protein
VTVVLPFRKVVVESPYRATEVHTTEQHRIYLGHCLADCRRRWEAPYASHWGLIDEDEDELARHIGIRAGWAWGDDAEACVAYGDLGLSPGMSYSIDHYRALGKPIEYRRLDVRLIRSILEM